MTAAVIAACVAFLAGALVRGWFAAVDRGRWNASWDASRERWRGRVGDLEERLADAQAADYLRSRLGDDTWLYAALAAVYAEVRPGERAENLTVQVRWKDTGDVVLIGIDRGNQVAERAMRLHVTNGEQCWLKTEDVDIPPADSPDWLTG